MIDKKTLVNALFTEKEHFEEIEQKAENVLKSIKGKGLSIDIKLGLMAAKYILEVLADPSLVANPGYLETYRQFITPEKIRYGVRKKEPRFNWLHIDWGIEHLIKEGSCIKDPGALVPRYKLKEDKK